MPPTKASNAAAQQPPTQQQGGRTPGTAFFAEGGGAESSSAQQVPTQTLKMQQAAARNRAQKPSGKTNDVKPVFKVHLCLMTLFRCQAACPAAHLRFRQPLPGYHLTAACLLCSAAACHAMSALPALCDDAAAVGAGD